MTHTEFTLEYNRLLAHYGMPHQDAALNRANASEWWEIFRNHEVGRFKQAVSGLIRGRSFASFPKVKELSDFYDSLGAQTTESDHGGDLSPRNRRLFAQYRAIDVAISRLPKDEKDALTERVGEMICQKYNPDIVELNEQAGRSDMPLVGAILLGTVSHGAGWPSVAFVMARRELYARENNMPLDLKTGLLEKGGCVEKNSSKENRGSSEENRGAKPNDYASHRTTEMDRLSENLPRHEKSLPPDVPEINFDDTHKGQEESFYEEIPF